MKKKLHVAQQDSVQQIIKCNMKIPEQKELTEEEPSKILLKFYQKLNQMVDYTEDEDY
jgi:hypothetical protein